MNVVEKIIQLENHQSFSEKDSESLGQYLSRMRRRKNVDLKNIAVTTRINYNILLNLENDVFENLPDRTYLRGFIRCLAKEIAAEEEYALNLLDRHLAQNAPPPSQPSEHQHTPVTPIRINSILDRDFTKLENLKKQVYKMPTKYLVAITLGLICIGTAALFLKKILVATSQDVHMTSEMDRPTQPVTKARPQAVPTEELKPVTAEEQTLVEEKAQTMALQEAKTEHVAKQAVPPYPPMEVPDIKTNLPKRILRVSPEPITLTQMQYPLYALNPHHPKLNDETLFPQKIRKAYIPGQENVFINAAEGDTWLVYKNSDAAVKNFILKQGRTLFLRGKEIKLFLGNLNAVEIFYNNQYLKAKTVNGVRSLIFPHKLAKESEIPFFIYDQHEGKYYTTQDLIRQVQEAGQGNPENQSSE